MRRIGTRIAGPARTAVTRRRARKLAASSDASVRAIGTAILAAERDQISSDEATWVRRIEAVRTETLRSEEFGEICRVSSKPPRWAYFLLRLVRELRPGAGLELGTCLGVSAAYQAAGLALGGGGNLISLEADERRVERARQNLDALQLGNVEVRQGNFQEALRPALDALGTVPYAFVDGHHDERATVEYFEAILPLCPPGAVLVFDDIRWSKGMRRAWRKISGNRGVRMAVAIDNVGICTVGEAEDARAVSIPVSEPRWTSPIRL